MDNIPNTCQMLDSCTVCANRNLEELVSFSKLPLTGIYCKQSEVIDEWIIQGIDQGLMYCSSCGHAQLKFVIDPELVYNHTYTHRGSISPLARGGNDFLEKFLSSLFPGHYFKSVVDIGCNDGYLLQRLEDKGENFLGIDPIWVGKDHYLSNKILLKGGFVQEIDLLQILKEKPDLIVSAHTFEHIPQPRDVLQSVVDQAREDALFIIEVPSLETLVANSRFDQVFHQHIQYFSLASFSRLIETLGCHYVSHAFNYSLWGGTMLVAFSKSRFHSKKTPFLRKTKEEILWSYKAFLKALSHLADCLYRLDGERIYGFGAAQMLPSLVHHIPSQLSCVKEILDHNKERQGKKYPGLPFNIIAPDQIDLKEANIVITALDSARPILAKLIQAQARRIFMPLPIIG